VIKTHTLPAALFFFPLSLLQHDSLSSSLIVMAMLRGNAMMPGSQREYLR